MKKGVREHRVQRESVNRENKTDIVGVGEMERVGDWDCEGERDRVNKWDK